MKSILMYIKKEFNKIHIYGWLLMIIAFFIPELVERNKEYGELIAKSFFGVHLIPAIIISYYLGMRGAVFVAFFSVLHHFKSDTELYGSFEAASAVAFLRVLIILMISHFVGRIRVREKQLQELNKKLEEKSSKDGLTQLYNFQYFYDKLSKKVNQLKVGQISLLLIDVDNFKQFNDTYGHLEGDKVLLKIASIFNKEVRKDDIVARYGGEEFAIILPNTDIKTAVGIAEKIRKKIASTDFLITESAKKIKLTVSIGCATADYGTCSAEKMVKVADSMLYKAKKSSKNRVESSFCNSGRGVSVHGRAHLKFE